MMGAWVEAEIMAQMQAEAARLRRPLAWVAQRAWDVARAEMARQPSQEPFAPAARPISVYLGARIAAEVLAEAQRLDRPISWVLWQAWKIARAEIMSAPSAPDPE